MVFAGQQELFPLPRAPGCIRHEIGQCLAPCAAICTRDAYAANVAAAVAFLEGRDVSALTSLERGMQTAAAALQFERAAALRDKQMSLQWLTERLTYLREAAQHSFVYPVSSTDGPDLWYLIHGGRVRAVLPAPRDEPTRRQAAQDLGNAFSELPWIEETA